MDSLSGSLGVLPYRTKHVRSTSMVCALPNCLYAGEKSYDTLLWCHHPCHQDCMDAYLDENMDEKVKCPVKGCTVMFCNNLNEYMNKFAVTFPEISVKSAMNNARRWALTELRKKSLQTEMDRLMEERKRMDKRWADLRNEMFETEKPAENMSRKEKEPRSKKTNELKEPRVYSQKKRKISLTESKDLGKSQTAPPAMKRPCKALEAIPVGVIVVQDREQDHQEDDQWPVDPLTAFDGIGSDIEESERHCLFDAVL